MNVDSPIPADTGAVIGDSFAVRHIGPTSDDQRAMLATLGYESLTT